MGPALPKTLKGYPEIWYTIDFLLFPLQGTIIATGKVAVKDSRQPNFPLLLRLSPVE